MQKITNLNQQLENERSNHENKFPENDFLTDHSKTVVSIQTKMVSIKGFMCAITSPNVSNGGLLSHSGCLLSTIHKNKLPKDIKVIVFLLSRSSYLRRQRD